MSIVEHKHIVYKVTNKIDNKSYIGKTVTGLSARMKRHLKSVNNGSTSYFHNAIRKYGADNFEWSIIHLCENDEDLKKYEKYYIEKLKTFYKNNGYNMTLGGDCGPVFYGDDNTSKKIEVREKLRKKALLQLECGKHPTQNEKSLKNMSLHHKGLGAKIYEITTPSNEKFVISNMKEFCENHKLRPANMYMTASGQQSNHMGYTCKRMN